MALVLTQTSRSRRTLLSQNPSLSPQPPLSFPLSRSLPKPKPQPPTSHLCRRPTLRPTTTEIRPQLPHTFLYPIPPSAGRSLQSPRRKSLNPKNRRAPTSTSSRRSSRRRNPPNSPALHSPPLPPPTVTSSARSRRRFAGIPKTALAATSLLRRRQSRRPNTTKFRPHPHHHILYLTPPSPATSAGRPPESTKTATSLLISLSKNPLSPHFSL